MLLIRKEQMKIFESYASDIFVNSLVEHIREFFPNHYNLFGERQSRKVVLYGVKRADARGFDTERNVCLYLDAMLILGSNFDDDIQLPWVADILDDKNLNDPVSRMDTLIDAALNYFEKVAGPNNRHLNRTFLTMQRESEKMFSLPVSNAFEEHVVDLLRWICPNKFETVGEDRIRKMVELGTNLANQHRLTGNFGKIVYIAFMFILGSGFDRDPQFSWANQNLNDPRPLPPESRADMLYQNGMERLSVFLSGYSTKRG